MFRVGEGRTARKISKTLHCFMRELRNNRKNMNIAVLFQGLLSRITGRDCFIPSITLRLACGSLTRRPVDAVMLN